VFRGSNAPRPIAASTSSCGLSLSDVLSQRTWQGRRVSSSGSLSGRPVELFSSGELL
jgi:hypothetical protein